MKETFSPQNTFETFKTEEYFKNELSSILNKFDTDDIKQRQLLTAIESNTLDYISIMSRNSGIPGTGKTFEIENLNFSHSQDPKKEIIDYLKNELEFIKKSLDDLEHSSLVEDYTYDIIIHQKR